MKYIVAFLLTLMISFSAIAGDKLHYTDTLEREIQKEQLYTALELAPTIFVYQSFDADGKSYAEVIGLRMNDSFKALLKSDFASDDPAFRKRLKRLSGLLRPLNVVCDLRVTYSVIPQGIAVDYDISEMRIWGRRAKAKEFDQIK